jgi:hypothetical protein
MAEFTKTQGRYLAFIHAYTNLHGYPPAEAEIAAAVGVTPTSVNLMVKMLEKKGLIYRQPGQPRTIRVIVPENEIPAWSGKPSGVRMTGGSKRNVVVPMVPPSSLYVLTIRLLGGPISEKFANKEVKRQMEIRGDQTLETLHEIIFQAFDRHDEHLYEFQFGKRSFDPDGPNYGIPDPSDEREGYGDARRTTLDDLGLKNDRVFGYRFDFGDDWFHQIEVERIEEAIPTVTYPRITKRSGKSPPQYLDEDHVI